ncbi:hypothetical protein CHS0354_021980 [Potamilus streckersoni]|uniref:Nicotinamide N-methyltransferase-like n=1 Tax=Potamilus streckersoni TaxID=2493646 RepID=A0AAE0VX64_9BIVA|nr:hypothetical protein CHS0354_021980 [Potamilus streckersoni]
MWGPCALYSKVQCNENGGKKMSAKTILTTHRDVDFDPETFISTYYSSVAGHEEDGDLIKFFLDGLSDAFKSGTIVGAQILDIGTGPIPHTAFCAAPWFEEITLSDFSQKNLDFLQKWKNGEINHMDPILNYLVQVDKSSSTVEKRQDELKRKIKNIVKCDVTQPNPVVSTPVDGVVFDAITSSLCLESASVTLDDYEKSVQNLSGLLKPGGHLVLVGVLEETFYRVGDFRFKCAYIRKDQLQDIWEKEGFEILSLKDFNDTCSSHKAGNDFSDFQNAFVMVAKKREY